MKRIKLKLIIGLLSVVLIGLIYSFTTAKHPKNEKGKKYEVIRSVNGQLTTYDTIISVKSDYTPEDYLRDLGFSDDEDVKIINLSEALDGLNINVEAHSTGNNHHKMVFISTDTAIHHPHHIKGSDDIPHEVIFKKEIRTVSEDGEETVHIETNRSSSSINIDSMINAMTDGDSDHNVFIEKIIISDDSVDCKDFKFIEIDDHEISTKIDGKTHETIVKMIGDVDSMHVISDFRVFDIDEEALKDGDHDVRVEMLGEAKDFTIVIVSEVDQSTNKKKRISKQTADVDVNLYPNPAKNTANLELNFGEKAMTEIQVIDMNGKVIYQSNLGEIEGNYRQEFDLSEWSNGVYIIEITHGDDMIKEKLIVE